VGASESSKSACMDPPTKTGTLQSHTKILPETKCNMINMVMMMMV
jgi:hypothetical protein